MRNSFLCLCFQSRYVLWVISVLCFSCGGDKPRLSKNSPEYQYSEVKEAMAEIKYEKAISLTSEIQSKFPNSESADKARILRLILLAGLSAGYREMADAYLAGFEKSIKNAGQLRSTAFDYYRKQKNTALGFYESCDYFMKNFSGETRYVLECEFPSKDITQNRRLTEVRGGDLLDTEQRRMAEEDELQNGLILALTRFLAVGGDRAEARKLLESGSRPLDPAEFTVVLGRTLLENQKLFGRTALHEVQTYRKFYQKASECSELALKILKEKPNKETQAIADELKAEIDALEKQGKRAS